MIDSNWLGWYDREVNSSPWWGDRRLEEGITYMTCIERIHKLFCSPVWAILLVFLVLLPFSRGVTIAIEVGCNIWLDWSLDRAPTAGWRIVSVARILVVLNYAGAFTFLSPFKLVTAHVTPRTSIVRLTCKTYISWASIVDVFSIWNSIIYLEGVFDRFGFGSQVDALLSRDKQGW